MTSILLLSSLLAQAPPVQTEKPGVVQGVVVSATSKEPVRRADVTLQPMMRQSGGGAAAGVMGGIMPGMAGAQKATTDAEGKFSFTGVAAGTYMLRAERSGFVVAQFGARSPGGAPTQLTVRAGQEVTGVRIEMTPQAVIAGRVLDEEGEPMQGLMVMAVSGEATPFSARRMGRRGGGMSSQTQTDDRGQFRLINLAPGKYVVQVMPGRMGGMPVTPPSNDGGEEMGYVTTYYPGVSDPAQASRIETTPGAELSGFEVRLKRTRVFRVRGKVLDPSGEPAKNYFVNVMPRTASFVPLVAQQFYPLPEGGFELRNVTPGSYRLMVRSGMGPSGEGMSHSETLEVGTQNIEGLVIRMQPPVTVKGQVLQPAEKKLDTNGMRVTLQGDAPMMMRSGPPTVKEDGTFEVDNVAQGKYRLFLNAPPGGYIESIRYGDLDATSGDFEISGGPALIQVVLRPGGATINGVVLQDGKPASGIIYLIPADPAKRTQMLIRSTTVDQEGAFTMSNLRPGDYLAFALSENDWGVWEEPEDFRAIESKAKKLSLKDTSTESIELVLAK